MAKVKVTGAIAIPADVMQAALTRLTSVVARLRDS